MNNFNNMSDSELLSILNNLADEFDANRNKTQVVSEPPVQQQEEVKQQEVLNMSDDEILNNIDLTSLKDDTIDDVISVEIDDSCRRASLESNGSAIIINPRPVQMKNLFRRSPDKSISPQYNIFDILRTKRNVLFGSMIGTSYSYHKSWKILINSIIYEFKDPRRVRKIEIKPEAIVANGREFCVEKFTDDELGINIYDMIDFDYLVKKLPDLEELKLDVMASARLVNVYGDTIQDISKIFMSSKKLNRVIINTGIEEREIERNRSAEKDYKSNRLLKILRFRSEAQYKADSVNPHKDKMSKGYIYGVSQNAKEMSKHSFGIAKEHFMAKSPHLIRTVGYSGLGLVIMTIGAGASVIDGVGHLLKRR